MTDVNNSKSLKGYGYGLVALGRILGEDFEGAKDSIGRMSPDKLPILKKRLGQLSDIVSEEIELLRDRSDVAAQVTGADSAEELCYA